MVTLQEVKQYLRIDFEDDDTLLLSLISTAKQLVMDVGRMNEERFSENEDVLELPEASPENQALEKDVRRRLLAAVKSMPPVDKEIFLRYYYEYQTMEQISASMDIPVGTIKSRLSRGRRRLKQVIMEQEAER